MIKDKIAEHNKIILEKLSLFLNFHVDSINEELVNQLANNCKINKQESFSILLAEACGLDIINNSNHMEIFRGYFTYMIHLLDQKQYKDNPYYVNIKLSNIKQDRWTLKWEKLNAYEAFIFNDLETMQDGRIIPQIGFFDTEFAYPALLENERVWMSITPNEIETMKYPIAEAQGKVLTYGLGLGYYAYMVSEKENVSSVTIVERDAEVISLFKKYILNQFPHKEKINIIHADAFSYAEKYMALEQFNFVFTDLWHDPSDGIDLYLSMKQYEPLNKSCTYMYWIEKTLLCYIE